jgi:hypothetical protein
VLKIRDLDTHCKTVLDFKKHNSLEEKEKRNHICTTVKIQVCLSALGIWKYSGSFVVVANMEETRRVSQKRKQNLQKQQIKWFTLVIGE